MLLTVYSTHYIYSSFLSSTIRLVKLYYFLYRLHLNILMYLNTSSCYLNEK